MLKAALKPKKKEDKSSLQYLIINKDMIIQVGKKYEVVEPEKAEHLGMSCYVKIIKEENGMFLGDNNTWYSSE